MSEVALSRRRQRAQADLLMWFPIAIHGALCLVVGWFTDALALAVAVLLGSLIPVALFQWKLPGHVVNPFLKGAAFMLLSVLLIEQSGGIIEAHFSIFIMLSALILYSDWRVIGFAGVLIALHHLLFTWLQHQGIVTLYTSLGGHEEGHGLSQLLGCLAMHAGAVVIQVMVLSYIAHVLKRMMDEGRIVSQFARQAGNGQLNVSFSRQEQLLPAVAAIDAMQQKVGATLYKAQQTAAEVDTLSTDLLHSQRQVAEQAELNATQIERISSSATQLASSTRDSAEETRRVRELAAQAKSAAAQGGEQVNAMRRVMEHLETQAEQIHGLLGEIDQITFQTNLLALNASVEAARAGENGRGFAVVAGEVRNLAGQTYDTASRIRQQIDQTRQGVSDGVAQTQAADDATRQVIEIFEQVASRLSGVDLATEQQNNGIEQLEGSIIEMHESLDLSRRSLNHAHTNTQQLAQAAQQLMAAVREFQLKDSSSQTPQAALPSAVHVA
ncbi:methyl-accepting chemotaxis protein [Halomonas sp. Bachu 37]|uniref:methyl-accepting chemotaxis protein n=1 Tax=Halomonas kashgarensis TaxID=3084920 RepID=UPI003216B996